MQLSFNRALSNLDIQEVCRTLVIHWYRPTRLTRGLMQMYLRYLPIRELFSCSKVSFFVQTKIYESSVNMD